MWSFSSFVFVFSGPYVGLSMKTAVFVHYEDVVASHICTFFSGICSFFGNYVFSDAIFDRRVCAFFSKVYWVFVIVVLLGPYAGDA